ncbi:MAG: DUF2304 domain-containing protein [Candidatus Nitronauta litoralis]|uniref:DUF2304 domain-containing protein n=1 Tax=Candidatus Nitronauta litoralis TaxID=2705533 RepID=A0A7T0FZL5_9BACT|nr:MAG: DUF2304 domain-containing protein [Candidatus Nitronauta litoralis]
MPPRIQIISILICIFLLAYVFELVRRRYLNEEYSVTWLVTGVLMLVLSISDELLQGISRLVGATLYTSTLFFFGLLFLVVICLHFSIRISALTNQVRTLTQDIGILYKERETLKERLTEVEKKPEPTQMENL